MKVLGASIILGVVACTSAQGAGGAPDPAEVKKKLMEPLPKEAMQYLQTAFPYMDMMTEKLDTDQCKDQWKEIQEFLSGYTEEGAQLRSWDVVTRICDLNEACVAETITAADEYVQSEPEIKQKVDSTIQAFGIQYEQLKTTIPMGHKMMCAQINSQAAAGIEDIEDLKDEL
mmetsp:Transcript_17347/g.28000  ORF Transcript_17347/g.28000 Transcript_17347/m.28000 type:complete len:172 (+) Transcript_17347:71-586(+)|eukprot:CAMPEP_0203761730 /NCGR_PEP_ID=MMETSP0098-20131031/14759_1 /ASSEMBLY_ACC=CAM_ASM_000208 /TAXON_ID=96639 /ORGANISM=" , Strain NY0313808BC1" /LENGTH=171 /DNA_ID=CAMNT_0050655851 /DNA_START=26 /DNA_END=541 /DNA_ORIENTATION=-